MNLWIWILIFAALAWLIFKRRGLPPKELESLLRGGAQVVDVRTAAEFLRGHADGALNIPLNQLQSRTTELDALRQLVLCCASGARSAMAIRLLKKQGFQRVHNAGPWTALPNLDRSAP